MIINPRITDQEFLRKIATQLQQNPFTYVLLNNA